MGMKTQKNQKKLYLYGVGAQAEVMNYYRTQGVQDAEKQIEQALSDWRGSSQYFQEKIKTEQGEPEKIKTGEIPEEFKDKTSSIANDPLFRRTFSILPTEFKIVEIDKLVAGQRDVNLDYVEYLKTTLPAKPTFADLLDFCLLPSRAEENISHLQNAGNAITFSTPNPDFRFLGGYRRELRKDDALECLNGGVPANGILLFVGFGGNTVNVLSVGKRVILNNGFHRVYALRDMGVQEIPVAVQKVTNPDLELGSTLQGLPIKYLINYPRPSLLKDFFDKKLTREVIVKNRLKTVRVAWGVEESFVPVHNDE